ncbi:MAG: parallel beta-helix domain-containing protein, partial [Bacteroidota bacterium]
AYHNVAGIEIENSTMADVYDCEATQNTGGILVFDLPDLPKKKGGNVRVYRNKVYQNDYKNFAPKGNTVAMVPPGTGVMVLATSDVEVFENEILENRSFGLSIISYHLTQTPIKDKAYYPYPTRINIHDNVFEASRKKPTLKSKFGLLMRLKFGKPYPNIIFDGIYDPETLNENGQLKEEFKICIRNNQNGRFAFLDAENNFKGRHQDASLFDCSHQPLSAPSIGK